MKEIVIFLDESAEEAIGEAVRFLVDRRVEITDRSALSVAFAGAGQLAALPVQLRPGWCRVWATAWGGEAARALVDEYAALNRERSRRVEGEVKALEANVYSEASWPAYEARLRDSLRGADPAAVEAKIAAFKRRWLALGKKAGAAPEEHLSA